MPIRLSDVQKDERMFTLTVDGESAQVVYRPSAYTPAAEDEALVEERSGRPGGALALLLARLLIRWEVIGEDGKEIPPTLENLKKMPVAFLGQVMAAIGSDAGAHADDRKNSGGGSFQAAK